MLFGLWELETLALVRGLRHFLDRRGAGVGVLLFVSGWRESFFGFAEKATSRPAWRSDYGGAEQCSAKPRLRPASVPDGDSIPPGVR